MDKIYSVYPIVLLVAYLVRLSLIGQVTFPDALIALGLMGLSLYNSYKMEQKEKNNLLKQLSDLRLEMNSSLASMDKKVQELEQIKTHLVSLKTANQMTNLARF